MNKLELDKKRDELAAAELQRQIKSEYNYPDNCGYIDGFNACADILLPIVDVKTNLQRQLNVALLESINKITQLEKEIERLKNEK